MSAAERITLMVGVLTEALQKNLQIMGAKLTTLELGQKCKNIRQILKKTANTSIDQETRIQDQETRKIIKWLSHLNFWSKQDDTFGRRQEGTGEWLLNDPTFQQWINGDIKVLWCPGHRTSQFKIFLTLSSRRRKDCSCVSILSRLTYDIVGQ